MLSAALALLLAVGGAAAADGDGAVAADAATAQSQGAPADANTTPNGKKPPKKSKQSTQSKKAKQPPSSKSSKREASTSPTPAKPAKRDADDEPLLSVRDAEARVGAGAMTGRSIYAVPSVLAVAAVDAEPALVPWPWLELSAPLSLEHTEAWAAPGDPSLRETSGRAALDVELRPWGKLVRGTLEVGVAAVSRPEWPDPYQPDDDGGVLRTDRFSHLDWWLQLRVNASPIRHHFLRGKLRYQQQLYTHDPSFDALERPNHLTPRDNDELGGELSWRFLDGPLRLGVTAGAAWQEWFFVFARDAGSGATHADAGGDPPNPLQAFLTADVEPKVELVAIDDAAWARDVAIALSWRVRYVDDLYAGYYSRFENLIGLDVEGELGPRGLAVAIDGKLRLTERRYDATTGYRAGDRHPTLEFGDARETRYATAALSARFPAGAPQRGFVTLAAEASNTNFPDYVPHAFPASQSYAVDWDYRNASVLAGLELSF